MKHFYLGYICPYYKDCFPGLVSYNRFMELQQRVAVPMMLFLKPVARASPVASTSSITHLRVCRNRRIHSHKVFDGVAGRGQRSLGWFYGFKLQHTRHRSVNNFLMNLMGALCAYHFFPEKPSLNIVFQTDDEQLLLAA